MISHIAHTSESTLKTNDGIALFIRDWHLPEATTKQGVVIMHGLGEHCGRYAHVARFFNALGFTVRTYDHRGHGQSGGRSGDVPGELSILEDAQRVIQDFQQQLSDPPILLGHSMGGLFAARFALANLAPLRGLILSSPALAIRMSGFQHGLLRIASLLFPGLGLPNGLNTRYLTHDAEVVEAYKNDRLVHPRISARLLSSMLSAMDFNRRHLQDLQIPTLLLAALDDHLVDPEGSRQFFAGSTNGLVSAHFYEACYHEIFNELDATRVFDDLRTWLEQQRFTPVITTA
jgi:alpha-beta hydrolase superfamily lysophospholipase